MEPSFNHSIFPYIEDAYYVATYICLNFVQGFFSEGRKEYLMQCEVGDILEPWPTSEHYICSRQGHNYSKWYWEEAVKW